MAAWGARTVMSTGAKNVISGAQSIGAGSEINWDHYNFPPLLCIIHFDLNEIQDSPSRKTISAIYRVYLITNIAIFLNCKLEVKEWIDFLLLLYILFSDYPSVLNSS